MDLFMIVNNLSGDIFGMESVSSNNTQPSSIYFHESHTKKDTQLLCWKSSSIEISVGLLAC